MADSLPGKVPDIDKLSATPSINPADNKPAPEASKFSSYMKETPTAASQPQNISPMQLAGKQAVSAPPTLSSVQQQMQATSGALGDIKTQLHTKGLKLKQSEKYTLRNQLTDANTYIRGAAERVGVPVGPPPDLASKKNPIAKFLELVNDGQEQMNSAAQTLQNLNSTGQSIDPGALLLIQVKLQKASQELDYTSVILGKAVDMLKTLMNVQI
ncbi:MAG: hypothetical protein JSR76_04355 [Verrucomicrobia bacterium]|nr:hypothetical protein [Verrucomicrobiota bacterium]